MKKKRIDYIRKYIENKICLDLGIVEHINNIEKEEWLHRQIVEYSKYCLGVDYLCEEIEKLKQKGYNVISENVETMNLNKKFDVIIAGELIEHLDNPGFFLENARKHLKSNGILILTTPNPWSLGCFMKPIRIIFGKDIRIDPGHVCWYDQQTLKKLLERHNFRILEMFTSPADRHKGVYRFLFSIRNLGTKIFVAAIKEEEK